MGRLRVPLRAISEALGEAGHPLSKDAIRRHLAACVARPVEAVAAQPESSPADPVARVVAVAARDVLEAWPSIATKLVRRLVADGAIDAAHTVTEAVPETMRSALPTAVQVGNQAGVRGGPPLLKAAAPGTLYQGDSSDALA